MKIARKLDKILSTSRGKIDIPQKGNNNCPQQSRNTTTIGTEKTYKVK